jgi:hypothetical protein
MPGDFKVTIYQKNGMGHYILAQEEQFANLIYQLS